MEQNRYAAPRSRVDEADAPQDASEVASRGRRLLNVLIDFGGYMALSMFIGVLLALVYPPAIAALDNTGPLFDYAFGIGVMMLYYVPLEVLFGRTLGKLLTGTRVINEAGERPSFGQVLGRTAARFIPFEAFSFLGNNGVGWHDTLSHTRVVRVRRG
jgi:uncharacterized RDD family membrane protein YckC